MSIWFTLYYQITLLYCFHFLNLSFCCSNWVISIILYSRSLICSSALFNLLLRASLLAQLVKNLPAMQETLAQFLGREDPLEKGKGTHSSILAWWIPRTVQSMGLQKLGHWATFAFIHCLLLSFCLSKWVYNFSQLLLTVSGSCLQ